MYRDDFYRRAELYDLEYSDLTEDLEHYRRLARGAGRVLELGAGSGRVTVPMAETGASVLAVDLSSTMLDRLGARLREQPLDVEVLRANFLDLDLGERFPLVVLAFNAIHHVYEPEDVLRLFDVVKRHLQPDGRFAMDMLVPDPDWFEGEGPILSGYRIYPDRDVVMETDFGEIRIDLAPESAPNTAWNFRHLAENGFYDEITQINHVRYHFRRSHGEVQTIDMPMRMYYPQEFLYLVRQAGLRIVSCDGDFEGAPLRRGASKMVLVLSA